MFLFFSFPSISLVFWICLFLLLLFLHFLLVSRSLFLSLILFYLSQSPPTLCPFFNAFLLLLLLLHFLLHLLLILLLLLLSSSSLRFLALSSPPTPSLWIPLFSSSFLTLLFHLFLLFLLLFIHILLFVSLLSLLPTNNSHRYSQKLALQNENWNALTLQVFVSLFIYRWKN